MPSRITSRRRRSPCPGPFPSRPWTSPSSPRRTRHARASIPHAACRHGWRVRLSLGAQSVEWNGSQMGNLFIAARLDIAVAERLRYVIPLFFDRVMAYPHLTFPLSKKLEVLAPEVFLPGCRSAARGLHHGRQDEPAFRRSAHARRESRNGARAAVAGLSDRSARHAVPAFLAAARRRARHRPSARMETGSPRLSAGKHRHGRAADSRSTARAFSQRCRSTPIRSTRRRPVRAAAVRRRRRARSIQRKWTPLAWSCRP